MNPDFTTPTIRVIAVLEHDRDMIEFLLLIYDIFGKTRATVVSYRLSDSSVEERCCDCSARERYDRDVLSINHSVVRALSKYVRSIVSVSSFTLDDVFCALFLDFSCLPSDPGSLKDCSAKYNMLVTAAVIELSLTSPCTLITYPMAVVNCASVHNKYVTRRI